MASKTEIKKKAAQEKFMKQLEAQNSALKKIIKRLRKKNKSSENK